jgi:hypothetical protein
MIHKGLVPPTSNNKKCERTEYVVSNLSENLVGLSTDDFTSSLQKFHCNQFHSFVFKNLLGNAKNFQKQLAERKLITKDYKLWSGF